jgi:hypothetical protein
MIYYTEDMADFGGRELDMAGDLLKALRSSDDHTEMLGSNVKLAMNMSSGYVFLTDEDYNVAMMNGDYLEDFIHCPECGFEGFREELLDDGNGCCREHLVDCGLYEPDEGESDG